MSLRDLQVWMKRVVTDPRGAVAALGPADADRISHPSDDQSGRGMVKRLDVYAEGYFTRIVNALSEDYRILRQVAGQPLFEKIVADYLKVYPSRTTNIGEVGRFLPRFLRTYAPVQEYDDLVDLAEFEWSAIESFYATEGGSLDLDKLKLFSDEDWSAATFHLDPSLRFVRSRLPLVRLWESRSQDEFEFGTGKENRFYMIQRRDDIVHVSEVSLEEYEVLRKLEVGATLSQAIDILGSKSEHQISEIFSRWISGGFFVNIQSRSKM